MRLFFLIQNRRLLLFSIDHLEYMVVLDYVSFDVCRNFIKIEYLCVVDVIQGEDICDLLL